MSSIIGPVPASEIPQVTDAPVLAGPRWRLRWAPWLGGLLAIGALAFVLSGFDRRRFFDVLADADFRLLALVPLTLVTEQLVRAWKWRQFLRQLRPGIGTLRLFMAFMAGYILALLVPFGVSTVTRSWLVARNEDLRLSAVFATVALDRLSDGVVYACLLLVAVLSLTLPDQSDGMRVGLIWAGVSGLAMSVALLVALALYRQRALEPTGRLMRLADRLPERLALGARSLAAGFAEGIAWPPELWRGAGVILAALAVKLLAATGYLWVGLALGVALHPVAYLWLVVLFGVLVSVGHFARFAGSFVVGAVFALRLLGVPEEQALAMALALEGASLLTILGVGSLSLWAQGVALAEARSAIRADAP